MGYVGSYAHRIHRAREARVWKCRKAGERETKHDSDDETAEAQKKTTTRVRNVRIKIGSRGTEISNENLKTESKSFAVEPHNTRHKRLALVLRRKQKLLKLRTNERETQFRYIFKRHFYVLLAVLVTHTRIGVASQQSISFEEFVFIVLWLAHKHILLDQVIRLTSRFVSCSSQIKKLIKSFGERRLRIRTRKKLDNHQWDKNQLKLSLGAWICKWIPAIGMNMKIKSITYRNYCNSMAQLAITIFVIILLLIIT